MSVNQETFFNDFAAFADALNGVAKLRELILQLAVQGKLVPQDADDEPAAVLLAKIKAEKERLIQEKKIKKSEPLPPIDANEEPFDLPQGWEWSRLSEVGLTNPRNQVDDDKEASFIPMTLIPASYGASVQSEKRLWKDMKGGFTHFAEDDVGLAKITPCFQNGKSAVMRGLINGVGAGTTELHIFRPLAGLMSSDYVLLYLKSPYFIETGIPKMTGTAGQKRVPNDYFSNNPFPLPPLAEQRRIVAKVDHLMALCDELQARQQRQQTARVRLNNAALEGMLTARTPTEFAEHCQRICDNFDLLYDAPETVTALRQAILQLAVQGKLVPQNPNDEPIHNTLKRVLERRAMLVRNKKVRAKKHDDSATFAEQDSLPGTWTLERLGNLVDPENAISYGVLVPGNDVTDGVPFVRAQDLSLTSHPERPNKTISPDIEKAYSRTRLKGGEILLCVVGSIGKLGIVPLSWAGANIARAVARILAVPEIDRDYLLIVLQSQQVQTYFTAATRTLAQPTLNVGLIEQTLIPLPPLAEQCRIVAKVDQLMALCDELEAKLRRAQSHSAKLMTATVQHLATA